MKINVDEISDAGLSLDVHEEGAAIEALAGGDLGFTFLSPVKAHFDISKTGRNIFISGDIKMKLKVECSRCLKEYEYLFETDVSSYYERGREEEREKELKAADLDVNYLEGPELDTTELILAQISLEFPVKPLCVPDCKGLCPKCGADLNPGDCGCGYGGGGTAGSKFAKLRDFKAK